MKGLLFLSLIFMYYCFCNAAFVTQEMNKERNIPTYDPPIGASINFSNNNNSKPPVVFIPGVGGSQLSAMISTTRPHWYCQKTTSWYLIWLSLTQLVPGLPMDCWSHNMMLNYSSNNNNMQFFNASGVDIMVNFPGTTEGFEYLDPSVQSQTVYFANLVNSFVAQGYVKGVNIFGAPFDWRLAPYFMPYYMDNLKTMIENAFNVNQSKVAVVAHSLGNLYFLSFLRTVPQSWKDKYLLTYVATAPPLIGTFTSIQALTQGYNFGIPYLYPSSAKLVQQTFISIYFMLPYTKYYQEHVWVSTPTKNYTSVNYLELLTDLGIQAMYEPYMASFNTHDPFTPPGVDVHCYYGYNVSTIVGESYSGNNFTKVKMMYGDGDGTVAVDSLSFCKSWADNTNYLVDVKGYKGRNHVDILSDREYITDVLNAILSPL